MQCLLSVGIAERVGHVGVSLITQRHGPPSAADKSTTLRIPAVYLRGHQLSTATDALLLALAIDITKKVYESQF